MSATATQRVALEPVEIERRPIIVATFPRSGTHLTIDLLRKQFAECRSWKLPGEPTNRLYFSVESTVRTHGSGRMSEAKAVGVLHRVARPIVKTHLVFDESARGEFAPNDYLWQRWVPWLRKRGTWLYVHRDGRDAVSSYHVFRQRVDPAARCSLPEFLRREYDGMSVPALWAWHVRQYLQRDDVLPMSFSSIVKDTEAAISRIGERVGLKPLMKQPLLPRRTNGARELRLNWLFGVRPESSGLPGRYQNQQPADWRKVFTREDRQFFHEMAGDMLIALGYEQSAEWVDA